MSTETPPPSSHGSDLVIKSALVRTQLSAESTLMAWIRTAVSLYTFGFTISKFFDYLADQKGSRPAMGPQVMGVALIGVGILALLLAIVEHAYVRRKLRTLGLPFMLRLSLPICTAVALILIGIVALGSILVT